MTKTKKHELGQYFTTDTKLKEVLYSFILNCPECILEPSIGRGDIIKYVLDKNGDIIFDMYEIDETIEFLDGINRDSIHIGNFLEICSYSENEVKKYKTIIGNPPYVKTKKGNMYIDFTERCYSLLDDNGELIFIVPSDFFKLTSAAKLLNTMMENGTFTHIYHPHNEKLFEDAAIDVIIYRYCKNKLIEKRVIYNDKDMSIVNTKGFITFKDYKNEDDNTMKLINELFDVYVGIVSGKDQVYKNEHFGNIKVLNGENKFDTYILNDCFPTENNELNDYLSSYKATLLERKIRKFNEKNWWEWGALRNIKTINQQKGKDCIYIYNLTRKKNVAFVGTVDYFGGSLIMILPKEDSINLQDIVEFLNSDEFKTNFIFSGRFKIGHRQLAHSYIPV
jgi:adenine-specific DNA-methyltransferase